LDRHPHAVALPAVEVKIPEGRRFTLALAALLAVALGVAYGNSFGVGFYFDDSYGIAQNVWIRSLRHVPRFFLDPFTLTPVRENVDVRPFLQITFALNYALSGLAPWSWHLFNLLCHLAASLLVFVLVRDHLWWPSSARGASGEARVPAAAAALLFALAPLQTQPLDYLWARSALLCSTLYLGAFWLALRRRPAAAALLHALALLTKAIAVTLPLALLAWDLLYRDRREHPTPLHWLRRWPRLVRLVAAPAALNLLYLGYRHHVLPDWADATRHEGFVTPWIWFVSQWPAHLHYMRQFVWPDGLNVDAAYPYAHSAEPRALFSGLALLAWIALALRGAARRPHVAFATVWFFLALAPESSFAALAEVTNDHRPYLATSLGLAPPLVWLLWEGSALLRARRAFVIACAALCVAAVPVVRHRNWQWQDPLRLWTDSVAKAPQNARGWQNLGVARLGAGDLRGAREALERARALGPGWAYTYMNLAVLAMTEGRLDDALIAADDAVRVGPKLGLSHYYRGQALEKLGRMTEAAAAYRQALAINPELHEAEQALTSLPGDGGAPSPEALMAQGLALRYRANDARGAAEVFRKVLERMPDHYGATYQLASALDASGRRAEARPLWEKMLRMAETSGDDETRRTAAARLQEKP
jgi:protein O-mannosyl-transferase